MGTSRASKNLLRTGDPGNALLPKGAKPGYSAKKAAAGKDIGKKGKNFAKIAAKAGKKYGSAAAGKRVAGTVLRNLRKG